LKSRTKEEFFKGLSDFDEPQGRVSKIPAETLERFWGLSVNNPEQAKLQNAALKLQLLQRNLTAKELANVLGISRPALYRRYGAAPVRAALELVRHEVLVGCSPERHEDP